MLGRVESSSSSWVFFRLKFIERLQFSYPCITNITWINLWAPLCGLSIVCRWENRVHLPFESLSYLQIDKQSKQKKALINIESKKKNPIQGTFKFYNLIIYIICIIKLTWLFRTQWRRKIRRPLNRKKNVFQTNFVLWLQLGYLYWIFFFRSPKEQQRVSDYFLTCKNLIDSGIAFFLFFLLLFSFVCVTLTNIPSTPYDL